MHSFQTLTQIATALRQKKISSVELTQQYLQTIENSDLNAFINVDAEGALHAAKKADLAKNHTSFFTGIPVAHKDSFCTLNLPTTAASKMLANYVSPYEATIVKKLREQGSIIIGKTNMDEFAMGSSNEHSYFGPVLNPWDKTRVPGGSSGGSAAAVAANLVPFATGSDTGGSIRQPAAFCGISGLKPTYGLISRFGLIAYASSLDQAGPMANCAEDLAHILCAMGGLDENDSTSISLPKHFRPDYLQQELPALKIGLPRYFMQSNLDPVIEKTLQQTITTLEDLGCKIVEIDLTTNELWVPCYYVIACAEASTNLSRYDGIRFGYRAPNTTDIESLIIKSRSEGFGNEVKRRILIGTHVLSSNHFSAYYMQAQKVRRLIQNEFINCFDKVDLIITPTTPNLPFKLNESNQNPKIRYLADQFTVPANLTGFPAVSIPAGIAKGLPIGMQFIGPALSDMQLLHLAHYFQQQTDWHLKKPPN